MTMIIMLVLALDNEKKRNRIGQKEKRRRREAIAMATGAGLKEKRRKKKIKQNWGKVRVGKEKCSSQSCLNRLIHHPPSGKLVGAGSEWPSSHACDNTKRTEHTSVDSKDVRTRQEFVHLPSTITVYAAAPPAFFLCMHRNNSLLILTLPNLDLAAVRPSTKPSAGKQRTLLDFSCNGFETKTAIMAAAAVQNNILEHTKSLLNSVLCIGLRL
jgi:hypothetical protein